MEMVCRIVLKNVVNMKRKWSWDRIVEECRENVDVFTSRKIYTATRAINEKVAQETAVKDFLLAKPLTTVQLNPIFLAK
jgi:asparagine synthetase A